MVDQQWKIYKTSTQTILPLTDEMTISIDANNINEDGRQQTLTITFCQIQMMEQKQNL